jgi:VWFA-related protein
MERTMRICAILVMTALLAGTVTAQNGDAPLIRTTSRLVQLNVVVVDKQDRPVTGLMKNDFRVFDNGVEQRIGHFSASNGMVQPLARSPLAVGNRQAPGSEASGMTVILVDETLLDPALIGVIPESMKAPIR